jgi:alpha-D-ribose 1-methylphosphonate 5-triphosphate synthase subunit PhnG
MTDPSTQSGATAARQAAMRVFAHADATALEAAYAAFADLPEWRFLRRPETGLVMVRGRIGGGGAPFNLGEMSVTRSAVALATGETGHAYVAGRNQRKAAIAAVFDALWQTRAFGPRVETEVLAPLRADLEAGDTRAARQAAATKVDFFTLVRGDD